MSFQHGEFEAKNYHPNYIIGKSYADFVDVETALRNSGTATTLDWEGRTRGKIRVIEFERRFQDFSGGNFVPAASGGSFATGAGAQGGALGAVFNGW